MFTVDSIENTPSARQWSITALLCLVLSACAFWPAVNGGFLWDDRLMVADNTALRTISGLRAIWLSPGTTFQYYPLTYASLWLEYRLWGGAPLGYHVVNLLLHASAALMLWRWLRSIGVKGALVAALLWCAHPVQVESVAWIAERKSVLSGLLYWTSLWLLGRAFFEGSSVWRQRRSWLGALLFVAALLAKTSAVTLPVVLLLTVWLKHGRLTAALWLRSLPLFGVAAALGAMTWTLESRMTQTAVGLHTVTLLDRLSIAGSGLWHYTLKTIVPWPLTAIYPQSTPSALGVVLLGLWLCIPIALILLRHRLGRLPSFAVLSFLVLLAPTLGFVNFGFMQSAWVADRFLYLPAAALVALVVHFIAVGVQNAITAVRAAAVVVCAVAIVLSAQRATVFSNESSLWNDTLAKNPKAWMAHVQLGLAAARAGQLDRALSELRAAEQLQPDSDVVQQRLGFVLAQAGQPDQALQHLDRAVALSPGNLEARNDRAALWVDLGRPEDAIAEYQKILLLAPPRVETLTNLGNALLRIKRYDEAAQQYSKALELDGGYAAAWNGRGALALTQARFDDAAASFSRAIALMPADADYRFNRGLALSRSGRGEEAVSAYREVIAIAPRHVRARVALVAALIEVGDNDGARRELSDGKRLGVSYPEELITRLGL